MFTEIKGPFQLAHSSGCCSFGSADMFIPCKSGEDDALYAEVLKLRPKPLTEEERIAKPWANPTHEFQITHMKLREGTALISELEKFYFPGGKHLKFLERPDYWLVIIKAEDILTAGYMFLSKEEGEKLLSSIDNASKFNNVPLYDVSDIKWDTDGDEDVEATLPKELRVSTSDEDSIADMLSEKYGFCLFSLRTQLVDEHKASEFYKTHGVGPIYTSVLE